MLASSTETYMKKIVFLIILMIPSIASADEFDSYLKRFFSDSEFQKSHISYPIHGYILYVCDSNPQGTCKQEKIFARNSGEWVYMGYGYGQPGVKYEKSKKCPENSPSSNCTYIELSQFDTDFNKQMYFKKEKDTWYLIYLSYFEP